MTAPLSLAQFNLLKDAEEYFEFFGLTYDPQIVNINRLHILRKFSQLVEGVDKNQSEAEILAAYSRELRNAYDLFVTSNSVEQKLFKVFKDKPKNVVMLSDIEVE
ncbi:nitrogenase-stabilizing/protective protein NifW [Nodosilinea sp. LEGE 07088]|uniref:nitrogenase-stabilizing/protective protein NifW n=1 Tax=Nodosilinea sp. LEGE 07088 TaxID=2777968 RepID=UPI00187FD445|nr:nitrogenase-stabilizing/protective protein NifW [Nodosilinea sp. LEGE 07088]